MLLKFTHDCKLQQMGGEKSVTNCVLKVPLWTFQMSHNCTQMSKQILQVLLWCLNKHHVTDKSFLRKNPGVHMLCPTGSSSRSHLFGVVAAWAVIDTMYLQGKTTTTKGSSEKCVTTVQPFTCCKALFLCVPGCLSLWSKLWSVCEIRWPQLTPVDWSDHWHEMAEWQMSLKGKWRNRWTYKSEVEMSLTANVFVKMWQGSVLADGKGMAKESLFETINGSANTPPLELLSLHSLLVRYPFVLFILFIWPYIPPWTSITSTSNPSSSFPDRQSFL